MFRRVNEDGQGVGDAFCEKSRANALARAGTVFHRIADDGDGEMDGFAHGALRGGDRIEARLELPEDFHEFPGSKFRGVKFLEHIEHIVYFDHVDDYSNDVHFEHFDYDSHFVYDVHFDDYSKFFHAEHNGANRGIRCCHHQLSINSAQRGCYWW
jgi:hypothetical protein